MKIFGSEVKLDLNVLDITKSVVVVIVLIYTISFINKAEKFFDTPKQQWDKTTIEAIAAGVAKAQVAESNKDLKATIRALQDASTALQHAQENDEVIKEIGQTVARIEDNTVSLAGNKETFDDRPMATIDAENVDLKDANGNPYTIATARYSPDVPEGIDKWSFNTWPRTISAEVILTRDEDGRPNRYMSLYTQSEWAKDPNERQPLKIESLSWVKGKENTKKFRFAPRIGFSGIFGTDIVAPALDYSLFSYGRTKVDMTWRFVDIAVGGNEEDWLFSLTPVSYNLGEILPVVSNLFTGPFVSYKLGDTAYTFGLSTSIPF